MRMGTMILSGVLSLLLLGCTGTQSDAEEGESHIEKMSRDGAERNKAELDAVKAERLKEQEKRAP